MDFKQGSLLNRIITKNDAAFSLEGMIAPTFQNEGSGYVLIGGRKINPGESYVVNVPGVILSNKISIEFERGTERRLYVAYVSLNEV